ncbi:hypothetical protein EJB05_25973, partial [Eragrostis curvula]
MKVNEEIKATILLAAVAVHAPVLMLLSRRRRRSGNPVLRTVLWGVSAMYSPLMSYVLTYLSTYISSDKNEFRDELNKAAVLVAIVLIQFLRAKADMAALAVAAVASPAAGDDNINSLKIRPSMENLVYTFWVAGLVVYSIFFVQSKQDKKEVLRRVALFISPLWILGAGRMVLRFASFQKATGSFALGRNVQLIDGYMVQLKEDDELRAAAVPRLIVTGERNRDVEESPMGYRVKRSTLQDEDRRLVTLDQVWSRPPHVDELEPRLQDLCLSFALFKCLRRRFAGYRLAEAGSTWALRFVTDRLLGRSVDDHVRVFRVIAGELSFARDFYYSPLPVASLGTAAAALHFSISFPILVMFCILILPLLLVLFQLLIVEDIDSSGPHLSEDESETFCLVVLSLVLTMVNAGYEIWEMVASVRSNWTKICIIGHYVRCRNACARRIFTCLLGCKSPKIWNDEIGQAKLFVEPEAAGLSSFKQLFLRWRNRHQPVVMVPPAVKAAVLSSFRSSGGKLSDGAAAVRRRCRAFCHDITWACHGGEVTTTTDLILVWHVATSLFQIRFPSFPRASSSSSTASSKANNILVAGSLSCYCMYLVAEAPDLLPDNSAWTKLIYEKVKKKADEVSSTQRSHGVPPEAGAYEHLVEAFSSENSSHELLKKGSKLGKQLVEEAERPRDGDAAGAGEDAVWELLAEFWSELVLYLAPSDNIKSHIEALQRGGELVTLLWALLLHAGITSRPDRDVPVEP